MAEYGRHAKLDRAQTAGCEPGKLDEAFAGEPAAALVDRYAELTGLCFLRVDATTGIVLACADEDPLPLLPAAVVGQLADVGSVQVIGLSSGLLIGVVPLPDVDGSPTVALTYALARPGLCPRELVLAAIEQGWSTSRMNAWKSRRPQCTPAVLQNILQLAADRADGEGRRSDVHSESAEMMNQQQRTRSEVELLRDLVRFAEGPREPAELAELGLERIPKLIQSDGTAIWLETSNGDTSFLVRGELPFDELGLSRVVARCGGNTADGPLIRDCAGTSALGAAFPGLRSLLLAPVGEPCRRHGWIVCCSASDDRRFSEDDASLLVPIAALLATSVRNSALCREHQELMLSFVRSLVSTLDAKDPHTRGHSERVALIARRIGDELGLPDRKLHELYLAGLLHDIGKIGVDDRVLQKPGQLDDEEFRQIQQHPLIGYSILKGLKNLRSVLPGVRNHHERFSGGGYPDGLRGEEIPLMARILAVSDSYDAMANDRPYRESLARETIESIFTRGAGQQWDPRIIETYFSVADDVDRICHSHPDDCSDLIESCQTAALVQV